MRLTQPLTAALLNGIGIIRQNVTHKCQVLILLDQGPGSVDWEIKLELVPHLRGQESQKRRASVWRHMMRVAS